MTPGRAHGRELFAAWAELPGRLEGSEEERIARAFRELALDVVACPHCPGDGCDACDGEGVVYAIGGGDS